MNDQPQEINFQAEGPQPLLRPISQSAPYPLDALGPLRDAVLAVQGLTQAPIAIPAASALALASLAVMAHADVETLGGTRPVSLYALTIAGSGERKSSCDATLMAALREYESEQAKAQIDAMQGWLNTQALWKAERDRILNVAKSSSGEKRAGCETALANLGPEPVMPPSSDRTVTEPTFEGLTRLFATGMPALGIFSDEGGQFLGGFAMASENRQKTLSALNDLWQGNPIKRTRSGDGSSQLTGRRLAIHLMVQPVVARIFMSDPKAEDTGFLPRFLICEPPSTIGTRMQSLTRHDEKGAIAQFSQTLRTILSVRMPIDPKSRALMPRVLQLEQAARLLLASYSDEVEEEQSSGRAFAHVKGYASKSAEQAARIAGVLALWRDLNAACVTVEDIRGGIELAQYYLSEAARLANAAGVSAEIENAEKLRKWLVERWSFPEIVFGEILQSAPSSTRDRLSAKKAIGLLLEAGWLVRLEEGTVVRGKHRKEAYRIVGRQIGE